MPLTGGPSDKAGNSYERRWTVFALIELLLGQGQSLRIEVPGEEGLGAEFRLTRQGVSEWHQAKRQREGGPWTISNMATGGVLSPWWSKIQAGGRCVFVSSTGAQELRELADRASSAASWAEFSHEFLTEEHGKRFQRLRRAWGDPPEEAVYEALHAVEVRLIGEPELARWIDDRLASLVTGRPATAATLLGQLADDSCHRELAAGDVWGRLAENGLRPRNLSDDAALVRQLAEGAEIYLRRLRSLYIDGRELPRAEAEEAYSHLVDGARVLVAGGAGSGKSVIVGHVAERARQAGWTILVLGLDRLPDAETTAALGGALGLPGSPTTVLAGMAAGGDALLVLDQLEAVSIASGRHPERLRLVEDLLGEAASFPGIRVVLASRQFDLDNDRKLRAVAADDNTRIVPVGNLDEAAVRGALDVAGLATELPARLLRLLTLPLHLAIYVELRRAGVSDASGIGSLNDLYDRYWKIKREACRTARGGEDQWLDVVDRLVDHMSSRQELAAPAALLDDVDKHASVMSSESVLLSENQRTSFFHETFFDYCFARRFVSRGGDLRELLTSEEQDLFRRAQVRQLVVYERANDFQKYLADFRWLLTDSDVRVHIKTLVVSLMQTIVDPTSEEWKTLRQSANEPADPLHNRVWQAIRQNAAWFPIVHSADEWSSWVKSSDEAAVDRALWALSGMAALHPNEIAGLVRATRRDEKWPSRLRGFLSMADVHAGRSLFDLVLDAVDDGHYDGDHARDLWDTMRELAPRRPEWAVELLAALLTRAIALTEAAGSRNPFETAGPLATDRNSLAGESVEAAARGAPAVFAEKLLPLMMELMRSNARPEWSDEDVLHDALWGMRIFGGNLDLRHDLFTGMESALRSLAETDPGRAELVLARLRADPHESAWFLLARGYAGNPDHFANDAAAWLTETPGALHLGYSDAAHWVSRELIAAISPTCGDEKLDRLVAALIGYAPPHERTYEALRSRGYGELCLLNGLDPARRPKRAERRLAELRRKFRRDDVEPPRGVWGGVVPPPIPQEKARKMTDEQWLRAMARHGTSELRHRPSGHLVGDASTQAQVLEAVTKDDPDRFARLLLRFPSSTAEPYVGGILRGLAGARVDPQLLLDVCRQARHIGGSDTNRWIVRLVESEAAATLPHALLDVVADIATTDPDPIRDEWRPTQPGTPPVGGGSLDGAGLNCTRGAAALALGALIGEDVGRLPRLRDALARLASDATVQVRVMVAAALTSVLYVDDDVALGLFLASIENTETEQLSSRYVERFLNHAIRRGHYTAVASTLDRMIDSETDGVRRAGARQLAVASFARPDLDPFVDAVLESDDNTRAGVVEVFADNVSLPQRRERSLAVLTRALADSSPNVRSAATRSFYGLEGQRLEDYEVLITAFAESISLYEHASAVFHTLESARQPLPPAVLGLCEEFVRAHGNAIGDISIAVAGDAMYVVRLAIRLHAQHTDSVSRRRSLDLIDQLMALRAHGIDEDLASIER